MNRPRRYKLHYALICSHMCTLGAVSARPLGIGCGYVTHAPGQEDRGWRPSYRAGPGPWDACDGQDPGSPLVQVLVAGKGQELDEVVLGGDAVEEFGGRTELVHFPALGSDDIVLDLLKFLVENLAE